MALSDMQLRQLRAKLDARHIRTRKANGTDLHYVEGFVESLRQAMSEAKDIELLYDLWEQNIGTLRTLHRHSKESASHHVLSHRRKGCRQGRG
jgi:hypothetical protein